MAVSKNIFVSRRQSTSLAGLLKCIILCALTLSLITCVSNAQNQHLSRLLVVLDDASMKSSHSLLFKQLDTMFEVTYKLQKGSLDNKNKDDSLALRFFDQPETPGLKSKDKSLVNDVLGRTNDDFYYDHLLLLTPSVNNFLSVDMSISELLQFFDSGRNIYIGLDENTKTFGRDLLKEFGVELFPQKSRVHGGDKRSFKDPVNTSPQEVAWSDNISKSIRKTIGDVESPVSFRGTGMSLKKSNAHVFPILNGVNDMYADNVEGGKASNKKKAMDTAGSDIVLVAGYQSRYNQRVVMSGSVDMCSDDFITSTTKDKDFKTSSNYQLCLDLLRWNFQQKSVLKFENFTHSLVDKTLVERGLQNNQEYKLKDEIQVSFDIFEKVNGSWVPFRSTEVQLQFIMLNPYVTVTLKNKEGSLYETRFHVPDHNGVYKFKLDFNKPGYTRLFYEEIAPVRVLNHDEFPKYEPSGYPYYAAVLSVVIATILFTITFATTEAKVAKKLKEE